jgi:hypothetical protein
MARIYACRSEVSDLVRDDAAADNQRAGADPGGAAVTGGALQAVYCAAAHPAIRGHGPHQHPQQLEMEEALLRMHGQREETMGKLTGKWWWWRVVLGAE